MRGHRLIGVLVVLLLLAVRPAQAQFASETRTVTRAGTAAAEFLSIPIGARATAMGNALSASVNDPTAIYWNPAGLAGLTQGMFTAEHAAWLADIALNYVAVAAPLGAGAVGVAVTALRTPEMEETTVEQQDGTGRTFTAASYAFALSYARALTDRFSIGGSVKYITERISYSTATGLALDVGTLFVTPFWDVRLGAAITNFGTKMRMQGDDLLTIVDIDPGSQGNNTSNRAELRTDPFDLPLTMRIGLAGEVFQRNGTRLTLALDALSPSNSSQYVNVGAELGLLGDLVLLRGGYSELFLTDSAHTFSLGGGLRYRFGPLQLALDYAYEGWRYFDGVNRFTLMVAF